MRRYVLYWNPSAPPELRRIMEQEMPADWTLRILDQGGPVDQLLPFCDFMIVADRAITAADLAQVVRLRVGYERVGLEACRRHGTMLGLTLEGTTTGVAEHTVLLILALYKQLLTVAMGVHSGKWLAWELRQNSFELAGKTLGLVGFGRIGRAVAARAVSFNADIVYFDSLRWPPIREALTDVLR